MSFRAYSEFDLLQRYESGVWHGEHDGIDKGRVLERKAILRSFVKNNLFGVTKNKNGSSYFKNGVKLDLSCPSIILEVMQGENE